MGDLLELTDIETALGTAWAAGRAFVGNASDNPTVRAIALRALILGQVAEMRPAPGRLKLANVAVGGVLDLSYIVPDPFVGMLPALRFDRCRFDAAINLSKSRILSLTVCECDIPALQLMNCRIDGDLDLSGSTVGAGSSGGGSSLSGDGLRIAGRLALRGSHDRPFLAYGSIRLNGVRVGGNFEVEKAVLDSRFDNKPSLVLEGGEIGGSLFLGSAEGAFSATGPLNTTGLVVKRDVHLVGVVLDGQRGHAMTLQRARISGTLRIRGADSASRARIKGGLCLTHISADNLEIAGVQLSPSKELTLDLRDARIAGALQLRDLSDLEGRHPISGKIDLSGASIGSLEDDPATASPKPGCLAIDGLTYGSISLHDNDGDKAGPRIAWLQLQYDKPPSPDKFRPQPFEQLAKVLRERGYSQDADVVAMKKRDWAIECRTEKGINHALTWLMKVLAGHGYKRLTAIVWTLAWLLIGTAGIYAGEHYGQLEFHAAEAAAPLSADIALPAPGQRAGHARLRFRPEADACDNLYRPLYALELMVPIVEFGQTADCRLIATGPVPWAIITAKALFQLIGVLMLTVLGVALTGLLRKD